MCEHINTMAVTYVKLKIKLA